MAASNILQCVDCGFTTANDAEFLNHPCFARLLNDDLPSSSRYNYHISPTPEPLTKWDDDDTRLLIATYFNLSKQTAKGKTKKKELFEKIAVEFNRKSKQVVTGEQCQRKWAKLEQKYKEVEDNNKKSGSANKDWKFMTEMNECIGGNPNIKPVYTIDTSSLRSISPATVSTSSDQGGDDTDTGSDIEMASNERKRKRKRKSKSSASEMLEFLKDFADEQQKAEEKKIEVMREMQKEKKEFFSQFLDIFKNK